MFGALSAVGQLMIVFTVFRFDSLVLTTITTTRKFFSIMASVLLYVSLAANDSIFLTQVASSDLMFEGKLNH